MPGFKDYVNGTILPESDLDDYVGKQVVMKFASNAARDAALTATFKRAGMVTIQDDTKILTVAIDATAGNYSSIGPTYGALLAWTPTVTQSAGVTKTVTYGAYSRVGRRITASCNLVMTGAGTASNLITVSLPVTAVTGQDGSIIGIGHILDVSDPQYFNVHVTQANAGTIVYFTASATTRGTGTPESAYRMGTGIGGSTFALAVNDTISVSISYEAAADN